MAAGIFLGLVILIRPLNGIVVLLVPFIVPEWNILKKLTVFVFSARGSVFFPAFLVILMLQPLLWHAQAGEWLIWSYRGEGFNFSRPEIMNVLFSYRKGLFIYTPLLFISLFGLIPLFKRSGMQFSAFILFLVLLTYLVASWWNWYYGDSFGMRPFIDFYGVFAILLALLGASSRNYKCDKILFAGLVVLSFFTLFQTWQYINRVIHPHDMNGDKYRYVFLRADSAVINTLGGVNDIPFYGADLSSPSAVFDNDLEKAHKGWRSSARIIRQGIAFSGKTIGVLDSMHVFSTGLQMPADSIGPVPSKYYCTVSLMIRDSLPGASNPAYFVASIDSFDNKYNYWNGVRLNDVPRFKIKSWRKQSYAFNLPEITNPRAIIKMYVWNPSRKPFYIDDLRISFFGRLKE